MSVRAAQWRVSFSGFAAALAAAAAFAGSNPNSGKTTFRWVDDQGVVHYSDSVPAPAAGKERTIMNAEGVPVRQLEGQKNAEQLQAEARERAALIKARQHDTFLMTTYTSVKDIEALRDSRLEQLKAQRAAGQQYIETLKSRLGALQTRALNFRPYSANNGARAMPDDLAENLVRTVNEMNTQTTALAKESEDETQLRAQFQADIERYKELHTLHSKD
jgi:Domain of unknown function (DUF4124)